MNTKRTVTRPRSRRRIDAPGDSKESNAQATATVQARQSFARRYAIIVVGIALILVGVLVIVLPDQESEVLDIEATELDSYPHDEMAFTQGLLIHDGKLYESTGRQSSVRIVDLESGEPVVMTRLEEGLFGEGITIWNDRLIQLTWQDHLIFEYDIETLELLDTHEYDREGWGLTNDGEYLILSDGTSKIRYLDPETYEQVKMIEVTMDGNRLKDINELEYVDGWIYANVWHKTYIVKISPDSGEVVARIELRDIFPRSIRGNSDAVLNGIAYDHANDQWYVTGKLWPELFRIDFDDE